ncbi:putative sec23/Sec24, trunk domain, von Willebrand factor A-like domain superfamily [Helianthus anomalus]
MPVVFFFLRDVSMNVVQGGATARACSAIRRVIADLPEGPRTMVGIVTFDLSIHFYNLILALQQPLMFIVPDVHDVYTPLQTDSCSTFRDLSYNIFTRCCQHPDLLLESIPTMFQNNKAVDSAFGAVLPCVGFGAFSVREAEGRTYICAGEKEPHKLLQPVDKTLKTMAIVYAEYQMYYYHPFYGLFGPAKLYNDLRWNVTRPQGFEAVIRVRCSQGLQVQEYSGNFCKCIPIDVDLPAADRFLLAFKLHRLRQSYHGNSETR